MLVRELHEQQLAEAESRRAQLEKSLKSTKADLDAKEEELNQERRAKAVLEATKKKVRLSMRPTDLAVCLHTNGR